MLTWVYSFSKKVEKPITESKKWIEAADIVIMTDEPSKIAKGIKISKKTYKIVWQNIIFALGIKIIVMVFGAMGMASMWEAVFADVGVAILAVLNAMRIMK